MGTLAERNEPRFNTATDVVMELEGRAGMQELWTANISKGGLFVVTRSPPAMGSRVKVTLETPDGSLALMAEVVHVVPPEVADANLQPAGVGLQFAQVTEDQRTRIQRYVDGIANALRTQAVAGTAAAPSSLAKVMEEVRALLSGLDAGNIYAALQSSANASIEELQARAGGLTGLFAQAPPDASPAQALRIQNAARALEKLRVRLATMAQNQVAQAQVDRVTAHHNVTREAKAHADAGKAHLERQNFAAAEAEYERALKLDPNVVTYQLGHAWALAVNPVRPSSERQAQALELLRPLAARYRMADIPYTMGLVFQLLERHQDAERAMQDALTLDKAHHGAQRLLRLLEARRQKAAAPDAAPVKEGPLDKLRGR